MRPQYETVMSTPIMYNRRDEANIRLTLTPDCAGKRDKIPLHAIVCEPVGATVAG